jgi:hypothetical protein
MVNVNQSLFKGSLVFKGYSISGRVNNTISSIRSIPVYYTAFRLFYDTLFTFWTGLPCASCERYCICVQAPMWGVIDFGPGYRLMSDSSRPILPSSLDSLSFVRELETQGLTRLQAELVWCCLDELVQYRYRYIFSA